jgi:hypothetical protein
MSVDLFPCYYKITSLVLKQFKKYLMNEVSLVKLLKLAKAYSCVSHSQCD